MAAEDVDGNLGQALAELLDLAGTNFVEIGAGTGRVTRILRRAGASVAATEPSASMLAIAKELAEESATAVAGSSFCQAEAKALPFRSSSFDAAIAGWVFAHQREWSPTSWQSVVSDFVAEAQRAVGEGGPIVLIETLGTGHQTPSVPAALEQYYRWLEFSLGFGRTWIRTDYQFASVDEAAEVTGGFFGPDFATQVRANNWDRIPECTGIWLRR